MTKTISKKEFLVKVEVELRYIRRKATRVEINRLDFKTFNERTKTNCIYGQMTGYCWNDRAMRLKSAVSHLCAYLCKNEENECQLNYKIDKQGYSFLEHYLFYSSDKQHKKIYDFLIWKHKGDLNLEFDGVQLTNEDTLCFWAKTEVSTALNDALAFTELTTSE